MTNPFVSSAVVNLKHSLWSRDRETWEQYAPGFWDRMKQVFEGGGLLEINTQPAREILGGHIVLQRGSADVLFEIEWDTPEALMPDEIPSENFQDAMDELLNYLRFSMLGEVLGAEVEEEVEAATFEELMVAIDKLEERVIEKEKQAEKELDQFLDKLVEKYGN